MLMELELVAQLATIQVKDAIQEMVRKEDT